MFKTNYNNGCITLNYIDVTYIFTKNTFNVSIVRIKDTISTIGSSEAGRAAHCKFVWQTPQQHCVPHEQFPITNKEDSKLPCHFVKS